MTPELHRPIAPDRIVPELLIEATSEECAALARRMDIPGIAALSCRYRLTRGEAGSILAEGWLLARVTRVCVVSLEEFETVVEEHFHLRFVPAGSETDELDPEADDEIPYDGAAFDLGEATAEQLALALDPYPRRPDAALPDSAAAAPDSPFAVLARRLNG